MAKLAEAYLHLKLALAPDNVDELGDQVMRDAVQAASGVYRFPVIVNVRLEEGSLKYWASVVGSLGAAIAAYPSVKAGAIELYKDAKLFGSIVTDRMKLEAPATRIIYRVERRTQDAGRIYRLHKRIDRITRAKDDLNASTFESELHSIQDELDMIVMGLSDEDAEFLINDLHISTKQKHDLRQIKPRGKKADQLSLIESAGDQAEEYDGKVVYQSSEVVTPSKSVQPMAAAQGALKA